MHEKGIEIVGNKICTNDSVQVDQKIAIRPIFRYDLDRPPFLLLRLRRKTRQKHWSHEYRQKSASRNSYAWIPVKSTAQTTIAPNAMIAC